METLQSLDRDCLIAPIVPIILQKMPYCDGVCALCTRVSEISVWKKMKDTTTALYSGRAIARPYRVTFCSCACVCERSTTYWNWTRAQRRPFGGVL